MTSTSRSIAAQVATWLLVWAALFLAAAPPVHSGERWGAGYFPNSPVFDQNGRELRFYDDIIKDKIVVVGFFYTRCKSICPLATARLAELADALGDKLGRDIFLVSISVDPTHDSPNVLKGYAEAFHQGPGWLFITGKLDDIRAINDKLGERMRSLNEHRNEVILGNDRTGEWARDSAFGDMTRLALNVQSMDPEWRSPLADGALTQSSSSKSYAVDGPPGQVLFKKLCSSCHAFKVGNRVGPDLFDVTARRSREWLERFIASPEAMRRAKDATALSLMNEYPNVRMPDLGLTKNDIADIVSYLNQRTEMLVQQAAEYKAMMHAAHAMHQKDASD